MGELVKFSTSNVGSLAEGGIDMWPNLAAGDIGEAVQILKRSEICIQASGEFGPGAEVMIEGSNFIKPKDDEWSSITDAFGSQLVFMDGQSIRDIPSLSLWIRPRISGGDKTTRISVLMRRITK